MSERKFPYFFALALSSLGFLGPLSRDGDLYFHLRWGEELLNHLSIPRTDTLTYTAFGAPSELHSWLGSTMFAGAYLLGGEWGLHLLQTATIFLLLFVVARYGERENFGSFWTSSAVGAVFLLFTQFADLRPFVFAAVFLMWGVLLLPQKKSLIFLWAILWVNFHGSGLVAPLVAFLFSSRHRFRAAGVAFLATLMTPQGLGAYSSAYHLSQIAMRHQVSEWMAPRLVVWNHSDIEFYFSVAFFAVVAAIFLRRASLKERLFAMVAVVLYLTSQRHIVFLLPVLVWAVRGFAQAKGKFNWSPRAKWLMPLSQVALLAAVILIHGVRWPVTAPMPVEAVKFLKDAGIRGNVMAHQIWGGYVAHEMPGEMKVAIDCRITVHEKMARLYAAHVGPDGNVDLGKVVAALPETDLILFPSEVALRPLFQKTGTVIYESPVATVVLLNTERNTENRIQVESYYQERKVPFSFREGFDVGVVLETPWWSDQHRSRYPKWDESGRAREIVAEIDFYRIRNLRRAALEVAKNAVEHGNTDQTVLFRLGELLLENGELPSARRWLSFLEGKFGKEATLHLHRALVRVDPLALR